MMIKCCTNEIDLPDHWKYSQHQQLGSLLVITFSCVVVGCSDYKTLSHCYQLQNYQVHINILNVFCPQAHRTLPSFNEIRSRSFEANFTAVDSVCVCPLCVYFDK